MHSTMTIAAMAPCMSRSEFNKTVYALARQHGIDVKLTNEALRYLRNDIIRHVDDANDIDDVVLLALTVLRERGVRKVRREHLDQFLGVGVSNREREPSSSSANTSVNASAATPATATADSSTTHDDDDGEAEWAPTGSLEGQPLWDIRRILDTYKQDGNTYYIVDWQPTHEPACNIPHAVIARFKRQRRALVRRTYIESEAAETK